MTTSALGLLWSLQADACRRLLATAWITYRKADGVDDLRRKVRDAFADGLLSANDIARVSRGE